MTTTPSTVPVLPVGPTPTISPAVSPPVITTPVKTKNPGRVAAGKRLAEISKAARERKKREALEAPAGQVARYAYDADSIFSYQNILAIIGVGVGLTALLYELYKNKADRSTDPAGSRQPDGGLTISTPAPAAKKNNDLESFD